MIEVKKVGVILEKTALEFEREAVLNPAVVQDGDTLHMFYRAVQDGNFSTIGYCKFKGPTTLVERSETPVVVAECGYETHGVEDARVVKIDGLYYMTYTAYDGVNARGALATSTDLKHFEKQGIITPSITYAEFVYLLEQAGKVNTKYYRNHEFYYQEADVEKKILLWDKDVVFFPRRINGKLCFLHRIRPGIQVASVLDVTDLTKEFWKDYCENLQDHITMDPFYDHESNYIGAGSPPIETVHGWLLIYHGVRKSSEGNVYSACAALLDINNPLKEIARLPYALFSPVFSWEKSGEVNNVVFPTGTAQFGDTLYIYYGAADEQIACASLSMSELISELLLHKTVK